MKKEKLKRSNECVCLNLRMAARTVTQRYEEALRPLNLKATQYSILTAVFLNDMITVSELADHLRIDRTSMTRSLSPLIRDELIRVIGGSDRRQKKLKVSRKGEKLLEKAHPLWEGAQKEVTRILKKDNWAHIREALYDLNRELAG